jgi:hypothetical protein
MDKCIVFYSWQSDLPNSTNRGFIQKALEDAARAIRGDDSIKIDPVIDRDTAGVPGSPDIANTIFSKIDSSDIFACDVSIINQGEKSRPTPNPNDLLELGYAIRSLGSERIIMIMNTAFGVPELLPFDLSKKRVSRYCLSEGDADKSAERKKLKELLVDAIKTVVSHLGKSKTKGKRSGEKARLKEECEEVLFNGNKQDWQQLVDELWRDIPKRMIEWKPRAEIAWKADDAEWERARLEGIEICLPSIVPILVAVENGREDRWQESVGPLRQLYLLPNQILKKTSGGNKEVINLGSHMLYFVGNLGMALAMRVKQSDFISKWMQLSMPAYEYERKGEQLWVDIVPAHLLWGKYVTTGPDPFKAILKICESNYISEFFPDKERLVKHLFLGNLGQSLFELGQRIKDVGSPKNLSDVDKQRLQTRLKIWPLWVLMESEEFKASTWELFGSSDGVIAFVTDSTKKEIDKETFWEWWKAWKSYCLNNMMKADRNNLLLFRKGDLLQLPGEPF